LSDAAHSVDIHVSAAPDVKQLARVFDVGAKPRRKTAALPNWRLKRVTEYVNEHFGDPIKLQDLAKAAGLTRMYFAAQFRASVGMSPHEYLTRERIKQAQILLHDPHRTFVDVALSVGFQTQSHFITVFGRYIGNTPRRWRMEHRFKKHREAKETPPPIRADLGQPNEDVSPFKTLEQLATVTKSSAKNEHQVQNAVRMPKTIVGSRR
jgi:AraC-like DNA-binding protein